MAKAKHSNVTLNLLCNGLLSSCHVNERSCWFVQCLGERWTKLLVYGLDKLSDRHVRIVHFSKPMNKRLLLKKCSFHVAACFCCESPVSSYDSQLRRSIGNWPKVFGLCAGCSYVFMGNSKHCNHWQWVTVCRDSCTFSSNKLPTLPRKRYAEQTWYDSMLIFGDNRLLLASCY